MLPFSIMNEYGNIVEHSVIEGNIQPIQPPPLSPRYGHGVCSDGVRYLYSFGGYTGGITNQLSRIDVTDMSVTTLSTGPSSRYGSTVNLSYYNSKLYLFGGTTNTSGSGKVTDFWCYDIPTDTWTNLTNVSTNFPMQRGYSAAGSGKVFLCAENSILYTLDLETLEWDSGVPFPEKITVYEGSACFDGIRVFLSCNAGTFSNYIYTYDTTSGTFFKGSVNSDQQEAKIVYYRGFIYAYRSAKLYSYDVNYDKWELISTGGTALKRNGLAEVRGALYSICGDTSHTTNGGGGYISDACFKIT